MVQKNQRTERSGAAERKACAMLAVTRRDEVTLMTRALSRRTRRCMRGGERQDQHLGIADHVSSSNPNAAFDCAKQKLFKGFLLCHRRWTNQNRDHSSRAQWRQQPRGFSKLACPPLWGNDENLITDERRQMKSGGNVGKT